MRIDYSKVVELSHTMLPNGENHEFFHLNTDVYDVTTRMPNVRHRPDIWYVLSDISFNSHISTHIEFPFHHWKEGADALAYPLDRLIGNCIAVDFTDKAPGEMMTLPEMQERAAGVQKGDIVFLKTGMDKHFKTPDWELQPYLAEDAMAWLIQEKAPRIIGTDASGFEVPGTEYQPNHLKMFQHGIAMIESATNLDALGEGRALCFVLPLRLKGVDACPVRIVAVREGGIIDG